MMQSNCKYLHCLWFRYLSKIPLNNFTWKKQLAWYNKCIKNSNKAKWVYFGYGIAFDRAVSWSFSNDFNRNGTIFGANNNSLPYSDNHKNKFLVLSEGPTNDINGSLGSPEKQF